MKKIYFVLGLLIAVDAFSQDRVQQLDSLFNIGKGEQIFNGNVLIAEKGNIVYQKSFGKADITNKFDLNSSSVFELASVSKQFTAMGIMLLKKQQKLNYEDSLRKFFPQLPYVGITIKQLLQHTSGLPDYMGLFMEHWDSAKIATNNDMIDLLVKYKPAVLFAPGDKWEYSNTGYALLASIIEKVSGKSFGDFLQASIFKPLDMKRTSVYRRRYEKKKMDNYAYGYVWDKTKTQFVLPDSFPPTATMVYSLDGIVGDGTVNSTTDDLLKWDRALYTERLVNKEMMSEGFAPAILNDGKTYDYGFGWGIGKFAAAGKIINHTGGWPGYSTLIERHLETDKTIVILQNADASRPSMKAIRNVLYGIKEEKPKEIKADTALLKQYIGEYELAPGFTITITTDKDKLFAQATGQQKFELFLEKEDLFFLKVVEAKIKFIKDEKGVVNTATLYQNGQEVPGKKIK